MARGTRHVNCIQRLPRCSDHSLRCSAKSAVYHDCKRSDLKSGAEFPTDVDNLTSPLHAIGLTSFLYIIFDFAVNNWCLIVSSEIYQYILDEIKNVDILTAFGSLNGKFALKTVFKLLYISEII